MEGAPRCPRWCRPAAAGLLWRIFQLAARPEIIDTSASRTPTPLACRAGPARQEKPMSLDEAPTGSSLSWPLRLVKGVLAGSFRLLYRIELRGLEHLDGLGERAVIVVNHLSFLDAPLLAVLLPGRVTFAINKFIAEQWWVRPWLTLVDVFRVDPSSPYATNSIIKTVRRGCRCVIFPEGRITETGALMKIYDGPAMVADRTAAPVVPVRLEGSQYTPFSLLGGKVRRRWFPKITITILPPRRLEIPVELKGRRRRHQAGAWLYDVMSDAAFEAAPRHRTVFRALLAARRLHGGSLPVLLDMTWQPVSYDHLVLGALILGRRLAGLAGRGEAVGLLLPNANAAMVAWFGLQAFGRVPAMLNFSAGPATLGLACQVARIGTVVTSRAFVERARLGPAVTALAEQAEVIYLEDLKDRFSLVDKLKGWLDRLRADAVAAESEADEADPAVILFTSGSEGTPKGVVLSHANLLANCRQASARIDFNPTDVVFNALPVFHSFGLTIGTVLPVISGVKTFLYPSPLHYRIIPEATYGAKATILFGTDTFLAGYARSAHPYDFYSVRYVFAGAERVREETRRQWSDRFGLRIFEGYGTTETAPVIAINTPMHCRSGTVGRLLPGMQARLEPVEGIAEGGRLMVSGPNVMRGYLVGDRPGQLLEPVGGWHDTGDMVAIDPEGFVRILGRLKRFAKIAGEMVSLGAVEDAVALLWPDHHHGVVALPDGRKGEQLVLATTLAGAERPAVAEHVRRQGLSELMVPRVVLTVEAIPVLGTGKTDYVRLSEVVGRALAATRAA
ncbi:MAG: AMP-binding protein [Azospirillum sp.]|nr:AMP-binding protein [Azospirillum sp.]